MYIYTNISSTKSSRTRVGGASRPTINQYVPEARSLIAENTLRLFSFSYRVFKKLRPKTFINKKDNDQRPSLASQCGICFIFNQSARTAVATAVSAALTSD